MRFAPMKPEPPVTKQFIALLWGADGELSKIWRYRCRINTATMMPMMTRAAMPQTQMGMPGLSSSR